MASLRGSRIVTLTVNPALDATTATRRVMPGEKMRCTTARHDPGGGGINVARVATVLDTPALAVFPVGGHTGDRITDLLAAEHVPTDVVRIAGTTRENLTVDETGTRRQFRFVLAGPTLTADETEAVAARLDAALSDPLFDTAFVVVSGSLPPGVAPEFHQRVADRCREAGARLVLDTSGCGLTHLRSGVHLLKPSIRELRECTRRALDTEREQVDAARHLIERGRAKNVLVSRGADAALLVTRSGQCRFPAPNVVARSGVGAGDALVAGVVVGLMRGWSLPEAVRLGMAAGAAMLLTPGTATCRPGDVWSLLERTPAPTGIAD